MFKYVVLSLAVVPVVYGAAVTDEPGETVQNYHTECLAPSGVNQDLVAKARQGVFTEDAKLKDHYFCVSKKLGFQNDAGEIQKDVLKAKLNSVVQDDAKTEELIKECVIKKDTPEETAYEIVKCYHITVYNTYVAHTLGRLCTLLKCEN